MRRLAAFCSMLVLCLAAPALSASALAASALSASALAASGKPRPDALLSALWTPRELAGSEADRVIGAVGEPDPGVPALAPGVTLPERPAAVPRAMQGAIRRVELPAAASGKEVGKGRKAIALTFDLCERANNVAGYENRVINLLRERNLRATFFAGGKWMRSHPEKAMQLMADARFEMGNHAWTHGNLALMTREEIASQMRLAEIQYANLRAELLRRAEAKGLGPLAAQRAGVLSVMRLPYGRSSELALDALAASGYVVIQWDVDGEGDEELHTPEELAARALRLLKPGSIMLMHANAVPQKTFAILRILLPELKKRGYETVTVSELLRRGRPQTVREGYFTTPGDNLQYDAIFPGKGTLKPDPARPFATEPVPPAQ
ncbi:MAG: polysaccharide deacetylase family protein [Desulfovibrio sp.]|jgi:peptidoglycan/xylan/chitin deacetylase (PgdA/CDA1 family)|nr:polysaccharide deacetylase family protein [Desulfovibrio sp.]